MNTRRISILLLVFALGGCASSPKHITPEQEASIGYLDGKYRVCRENCPAPTPKEIDDSVPMDILISEMVKNSISMSSQTQVAEMGGRGVVREPVGTSTTTQQHEIYFDFGMSYPNAEGESELRKFEESIRGLSNLKIELIGKTDAIGSMQFNKRLARKRAKHIAARIKALDIKAQVELSIKAKCCHPAPYDRNAPAFKGDRKVTIKYQQIKKGGG